MVRILYRLLALSILLGSLGLGWLWMDLQQFLQRPLELPEAGYTLVIEPGSNLRRVSARLAADGVLAHPLYLRAWARWQRLGTAIKAGEYRLDPGLTPLTMLQLLISGKGILHGLTIIEGWDFRQMRQALAAESSLRHTLEGMDDAHVMAAIGAPGYFPEGRFMPDTYRFAAGTADTVLLRRAFAAMREFLARAWTTRAPDLPYHSPYEALILASIIEKETGVAAERAQIAGVFVRRLQKKMRLQTDPTVIYGLGDAFDGNLRRRDLRSPSPYNTYLNRGLPPTPIALPGRAAIEAALHPAPGKALYFVARGDGTHEFSTTLAQHNRAVQQYQLNHGKKR